MRCQWCDYTIISHPCWSCLVETFLLSSVPLTELFDDEDCKPTIRRIVFNHPNSNDNAIIRRVAEKQ